MKIIITLSLTIFSLFSYSQKSENLYRLARLHYQNLEYDEALVDVNAALNKSKKYYDAYLLRADIYYNLEDTANSLSDLRKSIELFPSADRSYFLIGMIYYDHEQFNNAWDNFSTSTDLYKNDSEYFYYKGETAFKLEDIKNACIAWNHGAEKLEDEDCLEEFNKNCKGIDITPPKQEILERKSLKELLKK